MSDSIAQVADLFHLITVLDGRSFDRAATSASASASAKADSKQRSDALSAVNAEAAESDAGSQDLSTSGFSDAQFALLNSLLGKLKGLIESGAVPARALASLHPKELLKRVASLQKLSEQGDSVIGNFGTAPALVRLYLLRTC